MMCAVLQRETAETLSLVPGDRPDPQAHQQPDPDQ